MKDFEFSLNDDAGFMLENFKKKFYDMGSAGNGGSATPHWTATVLSYPKM